MRVCGPRLQHFFKCGPPYEKFAHPWRRAIDTFEIFDEVCDWVFEMSRHEFPERCLTDTTVINREQL